MKKCIVMLSAAIFINFANSSQSMDNAINNYKVSEEKLIEMGFNINDESIDYSGVVNDNNVSVSIGKKIISKFNYLEGSKLCKINPVFIVEYFKNFSSAIYFGVSNQNNIESIKSNIANELMPVEFNKGDWSVQFWISKEDYKKFNINDSSEAKPEAELKKYNFSVFPNPIYGGDFTIGAAEDIRGEIKIELIDSRGDLKKELFNGNNFNKEMKFTISESEINSGMYIAAIYLNGALIGKERLMVIK